MAEDGRVQPLGRQARGHAVAGAAGTSAGGDAYLGGQLLEGVRERVRVDWAAVTPVAHKVEINPGGAEGHPAYQLGSPVLAQWLELPVCRRCHRD